MKVGGTDESGTYLRLALGLVQSPGAHLELLEEGALVLGEGGEAGEQELDHVCEAVLGRLPQQLAQPRLKADPRRKFTNSELLPYFVSD